MSKFHKWSSSLVLAAAIFCAAITVPDPGAGAQGINPDSKSADMLSIQRRIERHESTERDLAALQAMVNQRPRDAWAHYVLALYLEMRGFEQLAVDELQNAVAINPDFREAHHRRCLILFRMKEYDEGNKEISQCERLMNDDGQDLFELGLILESTGNKKGAQRLYEKAARAKKHSLGIGVSVARLRMNQGRLEEALQALDWDLQIDHANTKALMARAEVFQRMGERQKELDCLRGAYIASPCDENAARTACLRLMEADQTGEAFRASLYNLTCATLSIDAAEAAKQLCLSVLKNVPHDQCLAVSEQAGRSMTNTKYCRFFHFALGDIFDRAGQPLTAMLEYQRGIENCPACSGDDGVLARGIFRLAVDREYIGRDYQTALSLYEKASKLQPEDVEIRNHYLRLKSRLTNRYNDFAWRLKDAFWDFFLIRN